MSNEEEKQTKLLREILKWIRFSGMKEVKQVLLDNLTDDTKKIIYHYSDGKNNTTYLKGIANVSGNNVIPNLWNKWKNMGIIEKISVQRGERGKRIFNLEDFGIPIPEIKSLAPKKADSSQEEIERNAEEQVNETQQNNSAEKQREESNDGQELREGNTEEV